jgi:hypothetical protein
MKPTKKQKKLPAKSPPKDERVAPASHKRRFDQLLDDAILGVPRKP